MNLRCLFYLFAEDYSAMTFGQEKISLKKFMSGYFMRPGYKAVVLFRLAVYFKQYSRILSSCFIQHCFKTCGLEISSKCECGPGLVFRHPVGTIIHGDVRIGSNCFIGGSVTIGQKNPVYFSKEVPEIGDNVIVCNGSTLLGAIEIGQNVIVGANSLVLKNVSGNSVVAGNPLKMICTYSEYIEKAKGMYL
jgi:serine acetyltransferase